MQTNSAHADAAGAGASGADAAGTRTAEAGGSLEARRREVAARFERLGDTFRELRCMGSERLVRAGVSMTHIHVLTMLRHHGPMPMSHLAEILDVSLSNATGIVDRLEERALVRRARVADDRRVVMVHLTDAADAVLEDLDLLRSDLVAGLLQRLDEPQLERLAAAIDDLAGALDAELASAADPDRPLDGRVLHDHRHAPRQHAAVADAPPVAASATGR